MADRLKLCWMYHDIMDLYGDKGNILTLKKRCEDRNISFELTTLGIGEYENFEDFDLIFFGGGADKEQQSIVDDLISKKENLKNAIDGGSFGLLVCGGYQLFGKYYQEAEGTKIEGLGFYPYYTNTGKGKSRCIGNIAIEVDLEGEKEVVIGFENHGGQTLGVDKPFGKVLCGCGNSFGDKYEGFYDGKVLGTYIHGPLLPKNPRLADFVIAKAMNKRIKDFTLADLKPIEEPFSQKAREKMLERMGLGQYK